MREYPRAPRTYEMMTVLHPDLTEEEIGENLQRVTTYITEATGVVSQTLRDSPWGRRRLAYPIRHGGRDLRDGYYSVFHFEMTPQSVIVMERELKLNDRVIRYLITSYEPKPIDPRDVEQAEIDAEDAAAAAYIAAQARAAAAEAESEDAAAEAFLAAQAEAAAAAAAAAETADATDVVEAADEASTETPAEVETANEADAATPAEVESDALAEGEPEAAADVAEAAVATDDESVASESDEAAEETAAVEAEEDADGATRTTAE